MTTFLINPGTEPVRGTLARAWSHVRAFRRALKLDDVTIDRDPAGDSAGRYGFVLCRGRRRCEVLMPGVPREDLDFGPPGCGRWPPRLYIDGDSWAWEYAGNWAIQALTGVTYEIGSGPPFLPREAP